MAILLATVRPLWAQVLRGVRPASPWEKPLGGLFHFQNTQGMARTCGCPSIALRKEHLGCHSQTLMHECDPPRYLHQYAPSRSAGQHTAGAALVIDCYFLPQPWSAPAPEKRQYSNSALPLRSIQLNAVLQNKINLKIDCHWQQLALLTSVCFVQLARNSNTDNINKYNRDNDCVSPLNSIYSRIKENTEAKQSDGDLRVFRILLQEKTGHLKSSPSLTLHPATKTPTDIVKKRHYW